MKHEPSSAPPGLAVGYVTCAETETRSAASASVGIALHASRNTNAQWACTHRSLLRSHGEPENFWAPYVHRLPSEDNRRGLRPFLQTDPSQSYELIRF